MFDILELFTTCLFWNVTHTKNLVYRTLYYVTSQRESRFSRILKANWHLYKETRSWAIRGKYIYIYMYNPAVTWLQCRDSVWGDWPPGSELGPGGSSIQVQGCRSTGPAAHPSFCTIPPPDKHVDHSIKQLIYASRLPLYTVCVNTRHILLWYAQDTFFMYSCTRNTLL